MLHEWHRCNRGGWRRGRGCPQAEWTPHALSSRGDMATSGVVQSARLQQRDEQAEQAIRDPAQVPGMAVLAPQPVVVGATAWVEPQAIAGPVEHSLA